MPDLKRDEIKYIRDLSKSAYKKASECYICGTTEELQFHHFHSMTLLWNKWKLKNGVKIKSVDDILENRTRFRNDHMFEIYEDCITICKYHHMEKLHKIYGKTPPLSTANKQRNWVEKQRIKFQEKM